MDEAPAGNGVFRGDRSWMSREGNELVSDGKGPGIVAMGGSHYSNNTSI